MPEDSFPPTITIHLQEHHRRSLDYLKERHREWNQDELLQEVINSGLIAQVGGELGGELLPQGENGEGLQTQGVLSPFPKPGKPKRKVEHDVSATIPEDLYRRLGLYLAKHPDMDEEEAIERLLGVALEREGEADAANAGLERAARKARRAILRALGG